MARHRSNRDFSGDSVYGDIDDAAHKGADYLSLTLAPKERCSSWRRAAMGTPRMTTTNQSLMPSMTQPSLRERCLYDTIGVAELEQSKLLEILTFGLFSGRPITQESHHRSHATKQRDLALRHARQHQISKQNSVYNDIDSSSACDKVQ